MVKTKRLRYFDVIKGIAIFMVVMGHVLTMCIRDIDSSILFKLIGQIHMPLFFFISGYFSFKSDADGNIFLTPDLQIRFKQLMIPFFVVSSIWIYYFPHSGLQSPLDSSWNGLYFSISKNGYWFTLCLFEIILIYAGATALFKRCKSLATELLTAAMIWAVIGYIAFALLPADISLLLGLELTFTFFPAFLFGVLAKRHSERFDTMVNNNTVYTISLLGCAATMYITVYSWEFGLMAIKPIAWCFTGLLHMFLIVVAIRLIKPWSEKTLAEASCGITLQSMTARCWEYLGKESLSIYLLHYFFLFPLTSLQEHLRGMSLNFTPTFVVAFIAAAIIIAITLGANYIIQKSPFLGLLLTGKISKQ